MILSDVHPREFRPGDVIMVNVGGVVRELLLRAPAQVVDRYAGCTLYELQVTEVADDKIIGVWDTHGYDVQRARHGLRTGPRVGYNGNTTGRLHRVRTEEPTDVPGYDAKITTACGLTMQGHVWFGFASQEVDCRRCNPDA